MIRGKMTLFHLSFWSCVFSTALCLPASDDDPNNKNVSEFKKEQQAWLDTLPQEQRWIGERVNGNWHGWGVKKEADLNKKTLECDQLKTLIGTRHEFEQDLVNSIYPSGFPVLKREDRYLKCVVALSTQTGKLAGAYRNVLHDKNLTIPEFCRLGCDEMYSPISSPIHVDIKLPDHCFTWETYSGIAENDPILKKYLTSGQGRTEFIQALLAMRQERFRRNTSTYDLNPRPSTSFKCALVESMPFYKQDVLQQLVQQQNLATSNKSKVSLNSNIVEQLRTPKDRPLPVAQIQTVIFKAVASIKTELICETEASHIERKALGTVLVQFTETSDLITALLDVPKKTGGIKIHVEPVDCAKYLPECEKSTMWELPSLKPTPSA